MSFDSVKIINIGCKTNYYDAQLIENQFEQNGFKVIASSKPFEDEIADIFIINSCTVTHKADRDSLQIARKIKKNFPSVKVILTGCLAELSENQKLPFVDFVVGNKGKFLLPRLVLNNFKEDTREIVWEKDLKRTRVSLKGRTRGFFKIQDGCDSKCTFCTVNMARGPERSMLISDVIEQLKVFSEKGFKEVNLTGIRIGQFGRTNKESFLQLLEEIEKSSQMPHRIRLGSIYPNELTDEFLSFFASSKKICKHLHISQQSLDNMILKKMNRLYNAELFISLVERIKKKMPDCFIGCDLITGFPGETEESFKKTYRNLENLEISDIHVFSFSPRKGTKAFSMIDQIDERQKKERTAIIKKLAETKKSSFYNNAIGKIYDVLFEKNLKEVDFFLKGLTDNYMSVRISNDKSLENKIVKMKITHVEKGFLEGVLFNGRS